MDRSKFTRKKLSDARPSRAITGVGVEGHDALELGQHRVLLTAAAREGGRMLRVGHALTMTERRADCIRATNLVVRSQRGGSR